MLLRQMEYFQAVIENGNFYDAAEQCHVSQSAVSQQIKKLEDELDYGYENSKKTVCLRK